MLLLGSYLFYAVWDWRFLFLILVPTCVDYACAIKISRAETKRTKTILLWIALSSDLAILFLFKYCNFFIDTFCLLLGKMGMPIVSPWHLGIILPIGISYYLFKSMSYTIDVYRKVITEPVRDFSHYATYLSFFPQILAGPIERAVHFLPQLAAPRLFSRDEFNKNCYLIFWGLFKKCFIADNLLPIVNGVFSQGAVDSGFETLIGAYAATFWIYADFSGYSDIAIGLAGCLGFKTMPNFNLPFFAKNPSDIWRRWHISLSGWCRDYIFYYLNRTQLRLGGQKAFGTGIAIIATMAIMGVWHGARWVFVLWGVYHGMLLCLQYSIREWGLFSTRQDSFIFSSKVRPWLDGFKIIVTFHLFVLGELLFCSQSVRQAGHFIKNIFLRFEITPYGLATLKAMFWYIGILVTLEVMQYIRRDQFLILKWSPWVKMFVYCILSILIVASGVSGGKEFFYARF
ncbi:MAG TPA: MBOAT family O-acyltransferase [Candidatus Omnitrophota bacterium]|nr:MBOAT family O-acyltransferase [Candidatus Omnitrophota bacterium]HPD84794.1 MBOAT family O-acyltransferase [Candidatus Omnitrophota bacterium]HRZ03652.1 MBOAT family O-acyltransferase [Candidatus Omnitrophota bacterium]